MSTTVLAHSRSVAFSEGRLWRSAARAGARYGPMWWLTHSPPPLGVAFGLSSPEKREKVRENLRRVIGQRSAWVELKDVLATFASYAACLAEGLAAGRAEANAVRVSLRGAEFLHEVLAQGRGVVVVTAHVGPWDAAAQALRKHSLGDVAMIMAPEPASDARILHDSIREGAGVAVHHFGTDPVGAIGLLRLLRSGGIVAAQIDRCPTGARAISVPFFGQSVGVPVGPFQLAALAGAPVVPVFVSRKGCFDYEGDVSRPLQLAKKPGESELRGVAEQATSAMEAFIRQHPTQWFHFSDG